MDARLAAWAGAVCVIKGVSPFLMVWDMILGHRPEARAITSGRLSRFYLVPISSEPPLAPRSAMLLAQLFPRPAATANRVTGARLPTDDPTRFDGAYNRHIGTPSATCADLPGVAYRQQSCGKSPSRMCLRRWPRVTRSRYCRVMTMRYRRHHRTGITAASAAFVVAVGAVVTSGLALAHRVEPGQHTVNVVPPPTYSSSDTQAAKAATCTTWDQAARTITSVGKQRASIAATTGRSSVETDAARTVEKRTMTAEVAFLRTQIGPATPAEVRAPITDWIGTQIDSMHGVNVRNWDASNDAITQGNDLVDAIDAKCGFS